MLVDARVADSAVPIWTAPPFWDYSRKVMFIFNSCKTSERAGGLSLPAQWLSFLYIKAHDPTANVNMSKL